jgi:hypothetical protein
MNSLSGWTSLIWRVCNRFEQPNAKVAKITQSSQRKYLKDLCVLRESFATFAFGIYIDASSIAR